MKKILFHALLFVLFLNFMLNETNASTSFDRNPAYLFVQFIHHFQENQSKNSLYFLNGTEITKEIMEALDQEKIERVDVITDPLKIKQFTTKTTHSLILINLKKIVKANPINTKEDEQLSEPLYFLNGIEITKEIMQAINTKNIENVEVFKDKNMVKKYTDKNVSGIILITIKHGLPND